MGTRRHGNKRTETIMDSLFETWREISGFEGHYMISNFGRIKSSIRKYKRSEILMKLLVHTNDYQVVWLRKGKIHKKFFVHRLVAHHFLSKEEHQTEVNHKDKNRLNNTIHNLEWVTSRENIDHRDNKKEIW